MTSWRSSPTPKPSAPSMLANHLSPLRHVVNRTPWWTCCSTLLRGAFTCFAASRRSFIVLMSSSSPAARRALGQRGSTRVVVRHLRHVERLAIHDDGRHVAGRFAVAVTQAAHGGDEPHAFVL